MEVTKANGTFKNIQKPSKQKKDISKQKYQNKKKDISKQKYQNQTK